MIAQQTTIAVQQSRPEPISGTEALSLNRIVGVLQVVLAARRASFTDDDQYWYTIARGM